MDPMSIDHRTKPFCHNHMSDSKLLEEHKDDQQAQGHPSIMIK